MDNNKKDKIRQRVNLALTREEMEFLEKLCMDSLFSTGSKISKAEIIGALIDAVTELEISADGISSKEELVHRILDTVKTDIDRRQYPRLKKNLHIDFRKMDSLEQYKHSDTEDISLGGFRIDVAYLGKPPSVHQIIEIIMKDPEESKKPIKAIGRIAWIHEKEDGHDLEAGVMLTYIREEDRKRFNKYISEEETDAKMKLGKKK